MFQERENWWEQDASNLSSPPCLGLDNHQIWGVCWLFIINCPLGDDFSSLSQITAADLIRENESAHINRYLRWSCRPVEENNSYWIINQEKLHQLILGSGQSQNGEYLCGACFYQKVNVLKASFGLVFLQLSIWFWEFCLLLTITVLTLSHWTSKNQYFKGNRFVALFSSAILSSLWKAHSSWGFSL